MAATDGSIMGNAAPGDLLHSSDTYAPGDNRNPTYMSFQYRKPWGKALPIKKSKGITPKRKKK